MQLFWFMNIKHVAILVLNVSETLWFFSPSFPSFTPINRWFWCSPKHIISHSFLFFLKLSSLIFFLLLSIISYLLFQEYFLFSFEILGRSKKFLLYIISHSFLFFFKLSSLLYFFFYYLSWVTYSFKSTFLIVLRSSKDPRNSCCILRGLCTHHG